MAGAYGYMSEIMTNGIIGALGSAKPGWNKRSQNIGDLGNQAISWDAREKARRRYYNPTNRRF